MKKLDRLFVRRQSELYKMKKKCIGDKDEKSASFDNDSVIFVYANLRRYRQNTCS